MEFFRVIELESGGLSSLVLSPRAPDAHYRSSVLTCCDRYSTVELKENTIIVVLGASGDLAKKKTVCHARPSYRCIVC